MAKCANCGKLIKGKPIFEKGKFFDTKSCQEKFHSKTHKKSKKNVCEFC